MSERHDSHKWDDTPLNGAKLGAPSRKAANKYDFEIAFLMETEYGCKRDRCEAEMSHIRVFAVHDLEIEVGCECEKDEGDLVPDARIVDVDAVEVTCPYCESRGRVESRKSYQTGGGECFGDTPRYDPR